MINEVDRELFDGQRPRVMRCGCKYIDNVSTGVGEYLHACDEHLARLRRRTVAILQRRRYAIAAGARSSYARLLAWRIDADEQRARIALAPWVDMNGEDTETIAYTSWQAVEEQLARDLEQLESVGIVE